MSSLFGLKNVEIVKNHAITNGSLAKYSVHLGRGIVQRISGTMIDVVPVHSHHRGRIFLTFADNDPKTVEVISKVMFAEDKKIKEPSISERISGV